VLAAMLAVVIAGEFGVWGAISVGMDRPGEWVAGAKAAHHRG
jgi:hypothetical protein